MCVIVKNMLFLGTKILHFRERISLLQKRYFQRIWRIMLFLHLYQIYMIDSDRRPLLKSASTDVIISNHGPILGYSQIGILSKLVYL